MTVYVVSRGAYSDWSIAGIFSSRAKAEAYIATVRAIAAAGEENVDNYVFGTNADFNDIEEWVLDRELKAKRHTRYAVGIMLDTGEVKESSVTEEFSVPAPSHYVAEAVPIYNGRGIVRAVSPRSHAHAQKIASDARRVRLALPHEHKEESN